MSVTELWNQYSKTKSKELRNEIVEAYIPLVKYWADRAMNKLPTGIEKDDLIQFGIFGLIEAIERYDAKQGNKFETYAGKRVKGSIIDRIREYGKASGGPSRTALAKSKQIESAITNLEKNLNRNPTSKEIADQLGVSMEDYNRMLTDITVSMPVSLDKMVGLDDNMPAAEVVKDENSVMPEVEFMKKEYYELLAVAIEELPENEKTIVILYYYNELTFKEIGNYLNKSEARVCQLHSQLIARLKSKLTGGD